MYHSYSKRIKNKKSFIPNFFSGVIENSLDFFEQFAEAVSLKFFRPSIKHMRSVVEKEVKDKVLDVVEDILDTHNDEQGKYSIFSFRKSVKMPFLFDIQKTKENTENSCNEDICCMLSANNSLIDYIYAN
ncbi:MAG: hypothetical protein RLN62_02140 [Rickettsiales bacterium]